MKYAFIAVSAAVLGLTACGSPSQQMSSPAMEPTMSAPAMEKTEPAMTAPAMMHMGSFITYEQFLANKTQYASTKNVLFFNASWCPSCQAITKALKADASAIVPDGTTVVSVDYDANADLRKEYGVTTQHTFVSVDKDGKASKSWSATSADQLRTSLKG